MALLSSVQFPNYVDLLHNARQSIGALNKAVCYFRFRFKKVVAKLQTMINTSQSQLMMASYHDPELLEGYLKQQCVDASGLLVWERKLFELDITHLELHIKEVESNSPPQSSVSLKGVKYAKEWSFSSPVSGYGFDMVWFSGKVWSFFADNEPMCKVWVSSINRSISINAGLSDSVVSSADNERFRSVIHASSLNNSTNSALNETKMEASSPNHNFMTPFSAPPTVDKFSSDAKYMSAQSHSRNVPMRYEQFEEEYVANEHQDFASASVHSIGHQQQSYSMPSSQSVQPSHSQHGQQYSEYLNQQSSYMTQGAGVSSGASTHSENNPVVRAGSAESVRSQQHSVHNSQQSHVSQYSHNQSHPSSAAQSVSVAPGSTSIADTAAHIGAASASVTSHKQSVAGKTSSQDSYLQFPSSVASTHTAASSHIPQKSSSRVIEHVLPHHPSGASVSTLQSYHESLLHNSSRVNHLRQSRDQASVLSAVEERSEEHSVPVSASKSLDEGSTRPPRGHSSSQSALSSVIREANQQAQRLHAPSTDSLHTTHTTNTGMSQSTTPERMSIQRQNTLASGASVASQRSAQQSSVHFEHRVPSEAQSVHSLAPSVQSGAESHANSQAQDHGDLDSEMHHRHSARVHPHNESPHSHPHPTARPPLPPSASRDTYHSHHTQHTEAPSLRAKSTDSHEGDDASSFCNSSYTSERFPFPDLESMPSSHQPSMAASTTTHNIQQRLLYGQPSGSDADNHYQRESEANRVTASELAHRHQQHHQQLPPSQANNHAQETNTLLNSVQMSARMDIQRELSAHAMAQDRPSVQAFAQEAQAMQAKCQLLEMQLQRKESETETLKQRLSHLQDRFDQSAAEFEQRLDLARDKERQLISESKREMENKLLRASNDNMSFFDAANKSMKLQHERELNCLREELQEERKRHSNLMERSQTLRERAERSEAETQQQLASLKDSHQALTVEVARLKREYEIERAGFEHERQHLQQEAQNTITMLQEEKEQVMVQAHQQLRDKIAEMNDKMQRSLSSIKDSDFEILRQELEGQRIRSLAELHKKCQREIEIVRTEERRLAAIEMENIRTAFLSREHQTSDDLIQLEKLHSTRVSQLEQQVLALKAENHHYSEQLQAATQEAQYGSAQVQRAASEMQRSMEDHAARAKELQRELLAAHEEIQESKVREASYRDQLSRVLTERRMQHAELIEARQQAKTGTAQAFQWRNTTKESELSIAAANAAVDIAREEIVMLESHLRQVEAENIELKSELQRADRLVYGTNLTHGNSIVPERDLNSLNFHNTTSLSTKHLLRSSLTGSIYPSAVNPDLMNPTVSSLAKTQVGASFAHLTNGSNSKKPRKALTPKRL